MHKIIFYLILIFFTLLSCNNSKERLDVEVIRLDNNLSFNFNEKFELVYKIPLETIKESLIAGIISIAVMDNIYILDATRQLFVFDNNGNFVRQIGTKGNGPGEYLHITDFYVTDSTVVIIDPRIEKSISYDKNGKYLKSEMAHIYLQDNIPEGGVYLMYDKSTNECKNIERFTEPVDFLPRKITNEYVLSWCYHDALENYVTEEMLDETNRQKLKDLMNTKEERNTIVIKYYFK